MRKVVKVYKPSEEDIQRNKRASIVIAKIIAILVALGLSVNLFTIHLYADKDEPLNPAYDKTYAQELNEQIRNAKLSLVKNKVYKMKGGKI